MDPLPSIVRSPETVPLSALNHFLYCPRRAYLIHAEGVFVDNEHTVLGNLAHEHVDFPGYEQRAGWTLLRALPLFSDTLGLSGKADLVEIRFRDSEISDLKSEIPRRIAEARPAPFESHISNFKSEMPRRVLAARPVEYKKGPKRRFDNDEVQLCAQALCLEEMFSIAIPSGAIFHAQSQQRHEVAIDDALRRQTLDALRDLRALLTRARIPAAELRPQCDGCSLHGICLPEATHQRPSRLFEPHPYP